MLRNYIKTAWKVLMRRKLYAAVTLFGISMTLTLLFTSTVFLDHLLSPSGTEEKFDRTIFSHTLRLLSKDGKNMSNSALSFKFIKNYAYPMETPELVSAYSIAVTGETKTFAYRKGKRASLTIRCTDGNYWKLLNHEFIEGKGYTMEDIDRDEQIVIMDRKSREIYFDGEPCLGKTAQINGESFKVVGVVENVDGLRFSAFSNLWVPYTHAEHYEWNYFGMLQVAFLAKEPSDIPKIQEEFANQIAKLDLSELEFDSAYAKPMRATLDQFEKLPIFEATFGQFMGIEHAPTVLFSLLVFCYLFLPGLNLVSLNSTRIMERLPEIGARKSFGATTQHLAIQFIIENTIITMIGAVISMFMTTGVIFIINQSGAFSNSQISPGFNSYAIGLGAALLLAILSGITPSIKLAKTSIVKTLKTSTK